MRLFLCVLLVMLVGCGAAFSDAADGGDSGSAEGAVDGSSSDGNEAALDDSSSEGGSSSGSDSGPDSSDSGPDGDSAADSGSLPPSCAPHGAGMTNCGANSENCCTSLEVDGGTYYRTYTNSGGGAAGEADQATVSNFQLDKYSVTVGRFRQFVAAWNGGAGYEPPTGSGKHTYLNGGLGLANSGSPGMYEPGWIAADDSNVSPTDGNLTTACSPYATWTASAGAQENLPITCLNWYEAYAFCIWDGGFLPSEAEWAYAAAGGSQQREYPWGSTTPGTNSAYAIYGCYYPNGPGTCTGASNIAPVGFATQGAGRWGHLDLGGDAWNWNVDWYATYVDPCTDCADLTASSTRALRGGDFEYAAAYPGTSELLPTSRNSSGIPTDRYVGVGVRCGRSP